MSISPILIITIIFSVLYFVMVMYYLVGWLRLKKSAIPNPQSAIELPFVSIIIPVRNEGENIQQCLESIFKQNYPQHLFEVIVIDDYSTDSTLQIAKEFTHPNLLVLDLQQYLGNPGEYIPNKKKAIALGIKNAKGELILTTDGDCISGETRVRAMAEYYVANEFKMITAPVMVKPAWWPLQIFQQMDVMNLAGITGATIRNSFSTMCNGANLMYAKETFHEVEGFKGNNDVPTGDDIFLMQKISERYPNSIGFVKNYDACVFTKPEKGILSFVSQRIRWISKSSRTGNSKVFAILCFAWFFNLLILLTGVYALQMQLLPALPFIIAGGTKLFADLLFNVPVSIFFRKIVLLLLLPVTEVFHVFYVVIIGLLSLAGKYRWKDRQIR